MATRGELKSQLRAMLGLASDDPLASDAVLNPILNAAYQGLVAEVAETAPDALGATASITLTTGSGPAPADLYQVRAIRQDDADGSALDPAPWDEIDRGSARYALVGAATATPLVYVSDDVTTATLWVQYTRGAGANDLSADTTVPPLLPVAFHDVIALEAAYAMALGAEQAVPPDVRARHTDRRARLFAFLRHGAGPGPASRTRMAVAPGDWP